MDSRKHIYYITVGDIQNVAMESLGRSLKEKELAKVIEEILDGSQIKWYEPIEELINEVANGDLSL